MDILSNKIQLAITEEEASIILNSISRFRGIYAEGICLSHPDDQKRQERSILIAESIRDSLEKELLERYHNSLKNDL